MTRTDLLRIGMELIQAVDRGEMTVETAHWVELTVAKAASKEPEAMGLPPTTPRMNAQAIAAAAIREGFRDSSHRQNVEAAQ